MDEGPPKNVGLGGDGDEICAVADVERAFGIKLDYADGPHWLTAGDLFASVERALPEEQRGDPEVWKRFAVALCGQTGANPEEIEPNSPLLSQSRFWARVADVSALVWITVVAGFVVAIAVMAIAKSQ
jgi:hypothetical protein